MEENRDISLRKSTSTCNGTADEISAIDKALLQPYRYIMQIPGKEIRKKLAVGFNYWLHIPEEKLKIVEEVVQMLHNASLLLDDIEDSSLLRRGMPVAHAVFGIPLTINAANYAYFLALQRALQLDHPKVCEVFTEQLLELHRGQGMEIYWRDSYTPPSEEEYRAMTVRKTGGLFGLALRLMQLFSLCQEDFSHLTGILGLYFQIRDDYCNMCSKEYAESKSFCEDLTEGKFNFPIIHAIHSHPEDQQIISILSSKLCYLDILRQRTKDTILKQYVVSLLERFGSFVYTEATLERLEEEATREIRRLGGNPFLDAALEELKTWRNS
ncbi:unnamed protein product [Darwinula stevensoni]|uniref:Geranylgeranyl pyrophosphate synthase n=1 Tax=Darwinula stevensoni TaxID=69355 RepID=A0A7R8X595_9CRUS|nr:unnamed protein product [Darwinula stevensoni]CAG0886410.1 unnamed protein product [Darwinula stevensoni]